MNREKTVSELIADIERMKSTLPAGFKLVTQETAIEYKLWLSGGSIETIFRPVSTNIFNLSVKQQLTAAINTIHDVTNGGLSSSMPAKDGTPSINVRAAL